MNLNLCSEITELIKQREKELSEFHLAIFDLKQFIKNPVETVPIDNIKFGIDENIRIIKQIDLKIKTLLNIFPLESTRNSFFEQLTQLPIKKPFTSADLPPLHYSMFDQIF